MVGQIDPNMLMQFISFLSQFGQQGQPGQPQQQQVDPAVQQAAAPVPEQGQEQQQPYQQNKTAAALSEVGGLLGTLGAGTAPNQDSWQYRLGALVAEQARHRMEDERNKLLMSQLYQQSVKEHEQSQKGIQEYNATQGQAPQTPQQFDSGGAATQPSSLAGGFGNVLGSLASSFQGSLIPMAQGTQGGSLNNPLGAQGMPSMNAEFNQVLQGTGNQNNMDVLRRFSGRRI